MQIYIYIDRARKVKCVHFIGLFNLYTVGESSFASDYVQFRKLCFNSTYIATNPLAYLG